MFAQEFDAATFHKHFGHTLANAHEVRMAVRQAKKYVLDYNASRQISDLGNPIHWAKDPAQLRRMARSPHEKLWIEFNARARRERLLELVPNSNISKPNEVFQRMAWLVEYHPEHPSVHRATLILDVAEPNYFIDESPNIKRSKIEVLPFAWTWNTDDVLNHPWGISMLVSLRSEDIKRGKFDDFKVRLDVPELSLGMIGYEDDFIAVTRGFGRPDKVGKTYEAISGEFAGELRYIMAFLASLTSNKVVDRSNVRTAAPKYTASRVLPPYEFTEVRITVPRKRRLAGYLAQHGESGIKKRQHEVVGFWRLFEHGSGPFCKEQHTWESSGVTNKQYCANCPAWRTWVMEHERGDPLLGRVEHIKRVVT